MSEITISCPLLNAARMNPQATSIAWGSRRISYLQLNQYVNATIRALKERDIRPGYRVALLSDNSIEMVIVLLGLWRLGAVAVPLNPKLPLESIKSFFASLDIRSVIYARMAVESGFKISLPHFEITDLIVFEHKEVFTSLQEEKMSFLPGQHAVVVLTSGSSGVPKAAVLSYGNLYFNALGSRECVSLSSSDQWLLSLPLFHVSGLGIIFRCLIAGAQLVIAPRADVLRFVKEGRASHVSLVSTQLMRLWDDPDFQRPQNLRAVLLGGSAISPALKQKALQLGVPVYLSYGLTEMASQVATGRLVDIQKPCARVLPYRELKIDASGEICVRAQTLFQGYISGKDIVRPVDGDGWFHTGDLGCLDPQGNLSVLGRKDDMFISGGENIHPQEIETALSKIPAILKAAVIPREDAEFGQRPVAFIQWQDGQPPLSKQAITQQLLRDLPKFKLPVDYFPWPASADGEGIKVDRQYLQTYLRGLTAQEN
jgi:O-succinylbenzoic acid--CoA ligase